jgi:hypothetical protein
MQPLVRGGLPLFQPSAQPLGLGPLPRGELGEPTKKPSSLNFEIAAFSSRIHQPFQPAAQTAGHQIVAGWAEGADQASKPPERNSKIVERFRICRIIEPGPGAVPLFEPQDRQPAHHLARRKI